MWENGHITNNLRPIEKPEDLKGIKLRVPGGVWRVKMFKDYGANPSPMPLAEVYSALQSGVRRSGESVPADRLGEVSRSPKISLIERPRLYAGLSGDRGRRVGKAA